GRPVAPRAETAALPARPRGRHAPSRPRRPWRRAAGPMRAPPAPRLALRLPGAGCVPLVGVVAAVADSGRDFRDHPRYRMTPSRGKKRPAHGPRSDVAVRATGLFPFG